MTAASSESTLGYANFNRVNLKKIGVATDEGQFEKARGNLHQLQQARQKRFEQVEQRPAEREAVRSLSRSRSRSGSPQTATERPESTNKNVRSFSSTPVFEHTFAPLSRQTNNTQEE